MSKKIQCIYWKKRRSKDPLTDPNSKPIRCILCDRPKGAMKELYRENDKWAHMGNLEHSRACMQNIVV